ncbi:hypothetical protein BO99DRAFT_408526 [Aspergillus violaceofuscus CBS 115571]|uniref:Uncharacterized protein n=1 Tax=Aspergillus violaceofuscus (strain CBS 115571) TaxID=1450538 RepID=A0A2V5HS93_ASPV1|nr:hypothetical protein BO99DRAFT_408526 [Aspergillus violaceofuscus CBS 115571]
MRFTAILPFLALASHPLTAFAVITPSNLGDAIGAIGTRISGRELGDLYCCAGVSGPNTNSYRQVQRYTNPGAAVGTNCNRPDEATGTCDSRVRTLVSCTGSFGFDAKRMFLQRECPSLPILLSFVTHKPNRLFAPGSGEVSNCKSGLWNATLAGESVKKHTKPNGG